MERTSPSPERYEQRFQTNFEEPLKTKPEKRDFSKITPCQIRLHAAKIGFMAIAATIVTFAIGLFMGIVRIFTCNANKKKESSKLSKEAFKASSDLIKIAAHSFYTVFSPKKGLEGDANSKYRKDFINTYEN